MKKIHMVPGWAEGNWHFKQFVRDSGEFVLEREAAKADVILAHSSGVYSLPEIGPRQSVVLIDPPYWPGRTIASRAFKHAFQDIGKQLTNYGWQFWLRLRFWNIVFIIIEPWRHIKIWRSLRQTFRLSLAGETAILIRDSRDAYCGPQIREMAGEYNNLKLVELPGLHETCWAKPDEYIQAILKAL